MALASDHVRRARLIVGALGVVGVTMLGLLCLPVAASAEGCPDIEVVFARGTFEPPGVGAIGQQFVDALRTRVGDRSFDVYPVNYPANTDVPHAAGGVIDAGNHIRATAANCPNTNMVLGGFSQGAAVMGYVTAAQIPDGYTSPDGITGPLPLEVANHVAAVTLLGKPSNAFLDSVAAPPIVIGSRYAGKTIDLCAPDDPVCSGGNDELAHTLYATNGMAVQAADFAVQHL